MGRTKNSVSLIGIVGKDAEMRQTQQGAHYAHISLATSMGGYKKKDGTDVPEVTQWHRVVAWNSLADFAGKYIKKGMKVAVDGMITYNTYKNQQGVDVNTTDIIASDIVLMTMPQGQQQAGGAAPAQNPPQQQGSYQAGGGYQQPQQQVPAQQQAQPQQQVNNNYQQGGYQPFPPPAGDDLPF
jgi:single-strand DNA-binding protein